MRLEPRSLAPALFAALLAAELDLVLLRRYLAWPSLVPGALVGILVYQQLQRAGSRTATANRIGAALAARSAGWKKPALVSFLGLALASFLSAVLAPPATSNATRAIRADHGVPRVLLIVVDTLRGDALSCAAPSAPPTPNIDRLAEQSFRFTRARSPAPWTLPSVCSLLTGLSPLVHRAVRRDSILPRSIPTLAERLAAEGYRTAAIGHNHVLSRARQLDRGFDEYLFAERDALPLRSAGFLVWRGLRSQGNQADPDARALSERAWEWIEEHADEDFFLWLHYYDPHLEYVPPAAFLPDAMPPAGMGWRLDFEAVGRIRGGTFAPEPDARRWIRALYDGEVSYLDQELGTLLERLKKKGLYEDTLLVLTSDHGEEFWEHDGFEHGHTVYEELLRVPLILKQPRQTQGMLVDRPVTLESIVPSVLALCGIETDPAEFSSPALFQRDRRLAPFAAEPALFATGTLYYQDRLSLLLGGWKYVRFLSTGREELFDLQTDPSEHVPRSFFEPEKLAEARARCDELLKAAEGLRRRYRMTDGEPTSLPPGELDELRRIGYAE